MQIVLAIIIILHGMLHVLGFLKGFNIREIPQLSTPIHRSAGVFWLIAAVLLSAAGILLLLDFRWWVLPALFGTPLSVLLVFSAWRDAKFGLLPNIVLILALTGNHFTQKFERESEHIAREMRSNTLQSEIRPEQLAALPTVVRTWLERSGVVGTRIPSVIHLEQEGEIQLAPGQGFRPIVATQVFQTDPPGYVWRAKVHMFGIPVVGRDSYLGEKGRTHFRIAGLIPVVDESNPKIDEGSLQRFFGEAVWFPQFYLSPLISWTEGPEQNQATATMKHGEIEVSAVFTFDSENRFQMMEAKRFYGGEENSVRQDWRVKATAWKVFHGIEIPVSGEVVWMLPEGEFLFYKWTIKNLSFD